ncbi:MAG: hypothetical protein ABI586_05100 [Candidatus Nanopelagicales bacterium]
MVLTVAMFTATALLAIPAANAATRTPIYDNVPSPLPGNVDSVSFESYAISELGGQVEFAGTARNRPTVKVVMSSWACQSGYYSLGNCSTSPGATFSHPLTIRVYAVGVNDEPGALIGAVTRTFSMPYRPSANYTKCTDANAGKWYKRTTGTCHNGKAFARTVSLGSLTLPDKVIISIAYNTTHAGYSPIGESAACYATTAGCAYDTLNAGLTTNSPPSVGAQPLPNDAYLNAAQNDAYCDDGTGGLGTFRLDAGCWTGYQPAFRVTAL